MGDPSTPTDPAARLADAEQRLAAAERFQKERLAVFSRALAAAEEIQRRAEEQAAAILDRAKLDSTTLDEAARRLRLGNPELAAKIRAIREQSEQRRQEAPPRPDGLEAELEAARRRLAIYESFEDTIQSVLSEALRGAHEIRTRSEEEAAGEAERGRTEIRDMREELARLKAELDRSRSQREALAEDVARLDAERRRLAEAPAPASVPERGRVEEFPIRRPAAIERDDIAADIDRLRADRAEMIRERDFQAEEVRRLRAERDAVAQQLAGLRDAFAATLQQLVHAVGAPGTAPALAPAAPAAPAPPQPAATVTRIVSPDSEVRVIVSPVASFSDLVRLEGQLGGTPGIRSVYVRDLRNDTATLIVNVATAMSLQDLADGLAGDLGASIERVADGILELKLPAVQQKDAGSIG